MFSDCFETKNVWEKEPLILMETYLTDFIWFPLRCSSRPVQMLGKPRTLPRLMPSGRSSPARAPQLATANSLALWKVDCVCCFKKDPQFKYIQVQSQSERNCNLTDIVFWRHQSKFCSSQHHVQNVWWGMGVVIEDGAKGWSRCFSKVV